MFGLLHHGSFVVDSEEAAFGWICVEEFLFVHLR